MMNCLIRVGLMGQVGRFRPVTPIRARRGQRVILRTSRGLEIGEFLAECGADSQDDRFEINPSRARSAYEADGDFLRVMTPEDELLAARLERRRHEAFESCAAWLKQREFDAQLVDVEALFDGGAIYFYFLGDAPAASAALEEELGEQYAAKIRLADFANLLEHGCGPACGTEEAAGCGTSSGGCSSCGLVTACHSKTAE